MSTSTTKIDLESYKEHDRQYQDTLSRDVAWHAKNYEKYGFYNQYEVLGFKKIVEAQPQVRGLHIDFGCGAGWLLKRTAPLFNRVIGVEPSAAAIKSAKDTVKGLNNVEFIEADMVEALKSLKINQPVYVTTCTVLSHINDDWVAEFLALINDLPRGSILHFGEPFGKNIQRRLWHIRSKAWWARHLPKWQMLFSDNAPFGYNYGLSGVCVGEENVISRYPQTRAEKFFWNLQGIYHRLRALASLVLKFLRIKKN